MRATASLLAVAVGCGVAAVASAPVRPLQQKHKALFGERRKETLQRRAERRSTTERKLQTDNGGEWPQEHYDLLNSGSTEFIGPGEVDGFCRSFLLQDSLLDPNAERFYATGSTAMSPNDVWFGGGSSNVLRILQMREFGVYDEWDLDLAAVRPAANPPATAYGIVASPAVWQHDIADSVSVPSADGQLYTLWWMSCITSTRNTTTAAAAGSAGSYPYRMAPLAAEVASYEVVPPEAIQGAALDPALAPTVYRVNHERAWELMRSEEDDRAGVTLEQARARAVASSLSDPFPACVQWTASMGNGAGNMPVYSPPKIVPGTAQTPIQMVLASETAAETDVGGVLHAFNAQSGAPLWTHAAIDDTGVSWGLTGVTPAVDNARNNMVFLAYGPRVVALSGLTGQVIAVLNDTGVPDPAAPEDYVYRRGYLDDGDQIAYLNFTYAQAVAYCNANATCAGFTHTAPDPYPTYKTPVWFKSAWKFTPDSTGWSAFQKPGFGIDPFVSSPVLAGDGTALYLHSASGSLWKINIVGNAYSVTMSIAWACDYMANQPADYTPCQSPPQAFRRSSPAPVYRESDGLVVPSDDDVVYRGDYVNGGWRQATTRGQRDELHAAIRDAYLSSRENAKAEGERAAARAAAVRLTPPTARETELLSLVSADRQPTPEQTEAMLRQLGREGRMGEVHALRTRSGYARLSSKGTFTPAERAAAAALGDTTVWTSVYPYSTPAMEQNWLSGIPVLVVPQFMPYLRGDEGVFCIYQADGGFLWGFNQWKTTEGQVVKFGRSRSSPAIDGDDFTYVAADIDDPFFTNTSGIQLPVLFALDLKDGTLMWASSMGFTPGSVVGHASPIIINGYKEANSAMMVADHGLVLMGEGTSCPTDDPIFECSGNGICDCTTGTCNCPANNLCVGGPDCASKCFHGDCDPDVGDCACWPCWSGPTCNVAKSCGVNSVCDADSGNPSTQGQCVCQACYSPDAQGFCTVLNACSGHGTCGGPGAGTCVCNSGYSGADCSIASGEGAATGPNAGATAAGVLLGLPAAMLAVGAAYLAYFKYKNPLKPLHAALPQAMQKRLGYATYSTSFSAPMGSSSPTKGGVGFEGVGRGGAGSSAGGGVSALASRISSALGFGDGKVPSGLMVKGNAEDALARTKLLASSSAGRAGAGAGGGLLSSGGQKGYGAT